MHDPGPQGLLYLNLHRAEKLAPFELEAQRHLGYIFTALLVLFTHCCSLIFLLLLLIVFLYFSRIFLLKHFLPELIGQGTIKLVGSL